LSLVSMPQSKVTPAPGLDWEFRESFPPLLRSGRNGPANIMRDRELRDPWLGRPGMRSRKGNIQRVWPRVDRKLPEHTAYRESLGISLSWTAPGMLPGLRFIARSNAVLQLYGANDTAAL